VTKTERRPAPGRLITLLAISLGLILPLGASELLARYLFPVPTRILFVPDQVVGYRHLPNQRVWFTNELREYGAWFATNQHGDPDQERAFANPNQSYRIAVIGDSMVEAAQVPARERFTEILAQELPEWVQTQTGAARPIEVLNFGTAGYGTAQEWLNYREHVRRFEPDLILLLFLPGNDVKNNSFALEVVGSCRPETAPFYALSHTGELVLENEAFYDQVVAQYQAAGADANDGLLDWLRARVRLVALAQRAVAVIRGGATATGRVAFSSQDACQTATTLEIFDPNVQATDRDWQAAWDVTAALLGQLAADVAQDGARFHVVIATGLWEIQPESRDLFVSAEEQAHYDWELPHRMTIELLSQLGISYTPLYPAMLAAFQADGLAVHYKYDGHYTPAGHQLLAQQLLPVLQRYLSQ
jgi:hypothetical protein